MIKGLCDYNTEAMMKTPVTELSRLIVQNWLGSLESLAEKAGVSVQVVSKAVKGGTLQPQNEKKIREALEGL